MSTRVVSHNNISPPIHRLPPELLMPIFYDAQRRLRDIRFAHVCRYWRAVLLAMPEFWVSTLTHLKISSRGVAHELLTHGLSLSAPHPIKVRVVFTGQFEYELLAPHAPRIVKLSARMEDPAAVRAFEELLQNGLPRLETLRYECPLVFERTRPRKPVARLLTAFSLPALRRLEILGALPLSMCITDTLEHLVLYGRPHSITHFRYALARCRSLQSLTLRAYNMEVPWTLPYHSVIMPINLDEPPPTYDLPRLRRVSVDFMALDMLNTLTGPRLNMSRPESLHLSCSALLAFIPDILDSPSILMLLPELTRLYLGRSHRARRVDLLGYSDTSQERLHISLWRNWTEGDALARLLDGFRGSGVTALAVDLPRLSPMIEQSAWGRPWAGADTTYNVHAHALTRTLRRMELFGGMPASAKVRFARWFVRAGGEDRLPPSVLTLCWVLDVARGQVREQMAREELQMLRKLVEEFHIEGCRLGRLELYGTLQSEIISTRVEEVSTNVQRCTEIAGAFVPRFQELVDVVVLV